ncbi:uncharacterized protein LOC115040885 [Echeneis naucrates]|uniref:Uncharacterized LOC115040885 n=1 Tax=Echeneis naucrates TaxID=173247 RepID=A0A665V313_ECHNA|nr:uncharacterized protein LOC115040885 [Echeneis naucrates]XP_029353858.1 uncharacterized protein LOC115040885 [Echeneis naucrates]
MGGTIFSLLFYFVLFLPTPPCTTAPNLNVSRVVPVYNYANWENARNICRASFIDLVTIRNAEENEKLYHYWGWIGLYHGASDIWQWSSHNEEAEFTELHPDSAENGGCVFKHRSSLKWKSGHCSVHKPFLCMDDKLVLVRKRKTWEEALRHCRKLLVKQYTGTGRYRLASLSEKYNIPLYEEKRELLQATNEVWVGLRFLAGHWWWLNKGPMSSAYLPRCPAQHQHCGVLVLNGTQWKTLNCLEKRHFLCLLKP